MSDRWRTDTWNQHDGWPITQALCTRCGDFRVVFGDFVGEIGKWKMEHERQCPYVPQSRCAVVMTPGAVPVLQCTLAAGHPVGPQFDWFTDHLGHIWEKP